MNKSIYTHIYPELASALTRALLGTWHTIVTNYLDERDVRLLSKPEIRFTSNTSYLGCWKSEPIPVIELQRELIMHHSWTAVLDVFYHEVAHQLASFMYKNKDIAPHGAEFREICATIGANPDASVEITALDDALERPGAVASSVVDKLRKLLTLAHEGDENEAQVALAKAMELMAKYGLTEEDANGENDFVTMMVGTPRMRSDLLSDTCVWLLHNYWGVYSVMQYQPAPEDPTKIVSFHTISGRRDKVSIALYVYDYIMNNMEVAFNKLRQQRQKLGRNAKRDFGLGFLEALRNKLEGTVQDSNVYALVHKGDAATSEYVHSRFPSLRKGRARSVHINKQVHGEGRVAGSNIDINPGVSNGNNTRLLN